MRGTIPVISAYPQNYCKRIKQARICMKKSACEVSVLGLSNGGQVAESVNPEHIKAWRSEGMLSGNRLHCRRSVFYLRANPLASVLPLANRKEIGPATAMLLFRVSPRQNVRQGGVFSHACVSAWRTGNRGWLRAIDSHHGCS